MNGNIILSTYGNNKKIVVFKWLDSFSGLRRASNIQDTWYQWKGNLITMPRRNSIDMASIFQQPMFRKMKNTYLVPRMCFNLWKPKIGIIWIHTANFFTSGCTENLQKQKQHVTSDHENCIISKIWGQTVPW